jgi:hydroxymethylpyrimidine kinase/phosphomethylpyrimidine kinase
VKVALTVAGSDPSGGAGVQGDLRTFAARGVHGLSAITCLTVQGTRGVRSVNPVDAALVAAQIDTVLDDVPTHAAKTGALATAGIVRVVADAFLRRPELPLVVDPVIASSSGATLLDEEGVRLVREVLMPRATVITPNVAELRILAEMEEDARDVAALIRGARRLVARGARAVLAKGGHLPGEPVDVLVHAGGTRTIIGRRVDSTCTHGTGCTLSAALAAELAKGATLDDAFCTAVAFVARAIALASPIGEGTSPLDPLAAARAED